jgi:hypothetical protein
VRGQAAPADGQVACWEGDGGGHWVCALLGGRGSRGEVASEDW